MWFFPFLKVSSYFSSFLSKTIDVHVCFIAMYRKIYLLGPCWELESSNFCLEQNWGSCSIQFSLHLCVIWLPWLGFHENTCNFFSIFTAAPISLTSDCDDFESHDAYSSLNYPRNYQREWKITVSSGMVRIGYRLSEHMGKVTLYMFFLCTQPIIFLFSIKIHTQMDYLSLKPVDDFFSNSLPLPLHSSALSQYHS